MWYGSFNEPHKQVVVASGGTGIAVVTVDTYEQCLPWLPHVLTRSQGRCGHAIRCGQVK